MKFSHLFTGKPYHEIKKNADALFQVGEYGLAKLEYEKALLKLGTEISRISVLQIPRSMALVGTPSGIPQYRIAKQKKVRHLQQVHSHQILPDYVQELTIM